MSRKTFIESHGATCANWTWSWSFVNDNDKFVIFGAWDKNTEDGMLKILSKDWEYSKDERRQPGFTQALSHIDLVENNGYTLKTFPMKYSDVLKDENGYGPAKIDEFTPILSDKKLAYWDRNWYAIEDDLSNYLPEEIHQPEKCFEGAVETISINKYERNAYARKKCIDHYGYKCQVCNFDFEEVYGELGSNFIHVHHIIPLSTIGKEYQIDPIKDLIPVCPNCHSIIHRTKEYTSIDELKAILDKKK